MGIQGVDCHSHNTCSKDTIPFIKLSSNWGLLRSVNSALPDRNALLMDMKRLPFSSFRML